MKRCCCRDRRIPLFLLIVLAFHWMIFSVPSQAVTIDTSDTENTPVFLGDTATGDSGRLAQEMEVMLRNGNLGGILSAGERLIKIRPDDGNVRALFAIGLASQGEVGNAEEQLNAKTVEKSKSVYRFCAKAMILKAKGETEKALSAAKQAISADDQQPYPYNIAGRLYVDMGKLPAAISAFKKAISLNPNFLPAYSNIGAVYYLEHEYRPAIAYFSEGIERNPGSFNAQLGLAIAMEAAGDVSGALTHYTESLKLNPESRQTLSRLATLQLKSGLYQDALENGRKMERQKIEGADAIIADASLHLNDLETAASYIKKLDSRNPDKAYLEGYLFLLKGRYDKAQRSMEQILEKNPNNFGAFTADVAIGFYLGKPVSLSESQINKWGKAPAKLLNFIAGSMAVYKGDWKNAYRKWTDAEGLLGGFSMDGISPSDFEKGTDPAEMKYLSMSMVLYFRNFFQNSFSQCQAALKKNPSSAFSNYFAGILQMKMGHRQEAAKLFEKATKSAPRFFSALYAAGELQATHGNFDSAISFYSRAAKVKPEPGLLIKLGILNAMRGNNPEAERLYKKVTQLAPKNFIGYNQLAWLYVKQGIKLDKAIELAGKANQLLPGNASIQDTLGWAYFLKRNYRKAKKYLESAKAANPNNPTILYHIGAFYHATGKNAEAKIALKDALERSSRFDGANEARKLLARIK